MNGNSGAAGGSTRQHRRTLIHLVISSCVLLGTGWAAPRLGQSRATSRPIQQRRAAPTRSLGSPGIQVLGCLPSRGAPVMPTALS